MSLRWRWALTLSIVAAVAIGLSISTTLALAARQLRSQVDEELRARMQRVVEQPIRALRPFAPQDDDGAIAGLDSVVIALDNQGNLILSSPNDPGIRVNPTILKPVTTVLGDKSFRVLSRRVAVAGERVGFVQIAIDITDDSLAIRTLIRRLSLVGALSTIVAGLVGWSLAGRATRPITELSEAASNVAKTEKLDITFNTSGPGEVGALARSFQTMMASLSNSRRQQQSLVSDASHELRTPLTALRTNLETLSRSYDRLTESQRSELIDAAVEEVNELTDLSAELVDLATDVRHSDEPLVEVDLLELADLVGQRFQRRSGLPISVTGERRLVEGRLSQLDRALSNLVGNAVKWSPPGAPILIQVEQGGIAVNDSGPGIPPADLPHIFDRFYRSTASRTNPGSGLGLAIVEHIITAHGGSVFAGNRPEGGAQVGFRI